MNINTLAAVASATAAVVTAAVTVVTFILKAKKESAKNKLTQANQSTVTASQMPTAASKAKWARKVAISVCAGIVAGLIVLFVAPFLAPAPKVGLTSPLPGTHISRTKTFSITGTVSHLGNETLWLADYNDGYYLDDEVEVNANGTWQAYDSHVGDLNRPLPFPMILRVILANTSCGAKLDQEMHSSRGFLAALPGGCAVAGSVTVNVTTRLGAIDCRRCPTAVVFRSLRCAPPVIRALRPGSDD